MFIQGEMSIYTGMYMSVYTGRDMNVYTGWEESNGSVLP